MRSKENGIEERIEAKFRHGGAAISIIIGTYLRVGEIVRSMPREKVTIHKVQRHLVGNISRKMEHKDNTTTTVTIHLEPGKFRCIMQRAA